MKQITLNGGHSAAMDEMAGGRMVFPRHMREKAIERALAIHQMNSQRPMTMRQIARHLKMSPSSHLMSILWDMVDAGRLVATPRQHRPNSVAWDFAIPAQRLGQLLDEAYR